MEWDSWPSIFLEAGAVNMEGHFERVILKVLVIRKKKVVTV